MLIDLHRDFSHLQTDSLTPATIELFREQVYQVYQEHKRPFAWRETYNPYHIVVSEIMLQQTQVKRVGPFYEKFIATFPDFNTLAQASLRDVLATWNGLGYNRRAISLQAIAEQVINDYDGSLPDSVPELMLLPGVGPNTAGSIAAFAFNAPTVFIETNIRTVFLHVFFRGHVMVHDKTLMPLIAQTVDKVNPRIWYYALMDYGTLLKQTVPNPSRNSRHHTLQSKFIGSDRRVRGAIVRHLTRVASLSYEELVSLLIEGDAPLAQSRGQLDRVLEQLCYEKILTHSDNLFRIYSN